MNETSKTLTIDGKEYDPAGLSDKAKVQIGNVRAVDEEIKKIEQHLAVYKTARMTYARALKEELDRAEPH